MLIVLHPEWLAQLKFGVPHHVLAAYCHPQLSIPLPSPDSPTSSTKKKMEPPAQVSQGGLTKPLKIVAKIF